MRTKKKIMIVDDNDDVVTTYRVVLERMGYGVVAAHDGRECLEGIAEIKPDLVLLDVRLPGLSGTEVCRSIKETAQTKDIPVVAITASMSGETRNRMAEVGADDFLLKPLDVSDLNRVVKRFLGV
ncbi:MAG: response regulator [Actinobacteria bacterium]|nr:response regulator [Actinomycetota bacterium]MCG2819039.1 response regulator [Actinomycetes bacterium]MBU4179692.1 response regulator [Actinomycetota bacterium]MBU4219719.1 response regulator [Actinomycetota bacterium]MBU4357672.1 response regulator [Actinomycetota bacterium]